jgi:predicted nucleic acid-binding protein
MSVLVDSSAWVEYFRTGSNCEIIDFLIDENLIVTNDIILAELIPFLKIRKQNKLIRLLNNIKKIEITANWEQVIEFQTKCLRNGLNGVGIPDLLIAQNAKQNNSKIYSIDKHFEFIKPFIKIHLFP